MRSVNKWRRCPTSAHMDYFVGHIWLVPTKLKIVDGGARGTSAPERPRTGHLFLLLGRSWAVKGRTIGSAGRSTSLFRGFAPYGLTRADMW